jgi:hypothetical protein
MAISERSVMISGVNRIANMAAAIASLKLWQLWRKAGESAGISVSKAKPRKRSASSSKIMAERRNENSDENIGIGEIINGERKQLKMA